MRKLFSVRQLTLTASSQSWHRNSISADGLAADRRGRDSRSTEYRHFCTQVNQTKQKMRVISFFIDHSVQTRSTTTSCFFSLLIE